MNRKNRKMLYTLPKFLLHLSYKMVKTKLLNHAKPAQIH